MKAIASGHGTNHLIGCGTDGLANQQGGDGTGDPGKHAFFRRGVDRAAAIVFAALLDNDRRCFRLASRHEEIPDQGSGRGNRDRPLGDVVFPIR